MMNTTTIFRVVCAIALIQASSMFGADASPAARTAKAYEWLADIVRSETLALTNPDKAKKYHEEVAIRGYGMGSEQDRQAFYNEWNAIRLNVIPLLARAQKLIDQIGKEGVDHAKLKRRLARVKKKLNAATDALQIKKIKDLGLTQAINDAWRKKKGQNASIGDITQADEPEDTAVIEEEETELQPGATQPAEQVTFALETLGAPAEEEPGSPQATAPEEHESEELESGSLAGSESRGITAAPAPEEHGEEEVFPDVEEEPEDPFGKAGREQI